MDHHTIEIPPDLLPRDGRFGSGPSRVPVATLYDLAATRDTLMGTSHRKPAVKNLVAEIRAGLTELYELPEGYEVILGVGGTTALWDMAAFGLVDHRSAHYVCGEFSSKFASVTEGAPHLGTPVRIESEPGSAPAPIPNPDADLSAFVHCETSTGVVTNWERFSDEIVAVDATSAAGAIEIDAATFDAYYFSPQKALASEGGLWVSLMSPRALDRIARIAASDRWIPPFLSLQTAVNESAKDQTYNTPAVATLFFLAHRLRDLIDTGGLAEAAAVARASSDHVYRWAEASDFATPFVADAAHRSPTVATIDIEPTVDATALSAHLRHNDIVDTESYRKLGRNQLRIATFPTIPTSDVEALVACIEYVVERMTVAP